MDRKKINLNDFSRILLSETAPTDVPIIFTNNWFCQKIRNKNRFNSSTQLIVDKLFECKNHEDVTIPMRYRIRKDESSYRHMGVLHPMQQVNIMEFYRTFNEQVLHFCEKSTFSIRKPAKVASTYFIPNKIEDRKSLKGSSAERVSDENKFKHSTSYYAYDRHTKLYQFFEDEEFFDLEGKYTDFWSIDISKCFDSIYTHSICWATKGKFRSKSIKVLDTFGATFDRIMQKSNFNETNGIVIGNEFSRIFAEIILQEVDFMIKQNLFELDMIEGVDYDIRRYVDDYFVFATSEDSCQRVYEVIENNLRQYKLFVNKAKTKKKTKPFVTAITKSKLITSEAINSLYELLFINDNGKTVLSEKRIRKTYSVVKAFINKVKSSCLEDKDAYFVMTGYVISALTNKVKELYSSSPKKIDEKMFVNYRHVFVVFLNISFHLFNVNPSFSNSIKISTLAYLSFNFFEDRFPEEESTIKLLISTFIKEFFESGKYKQTIAKGVDYFPIEFSNLLFVARNMGKEYLLNQKQIKNIFDLDSIKKRRKDFLQTEENTDYFQIISILYYIGDEKFYNRIKSDVIKEINARLTKLNNLKKDAKLCFLILDCIACPFLPTNYRKTWAGKLLEFLLEKKQTKDEIDLFFNEIENEQWFISWHYPDLWNTLEKKELQFEYG